MKNKSVNAVLTFCLGIYLAVCSHLAFASDVDNIKGLVDLLRDKGVSVSTNTGDLLADENAIVLTTGQMNDGQVAKYHEQYGSFPLVLPLTAKLSGQSVDSDEKVKGLKTDRVFAEALQQGSIVYLYLNHKQLESSATDLRSSLATLLDSGFQAELRSSDYAALPAEYIQQWLVSLGRLEPQYSGGYK